MNETATMNVEKRENANSKANKRFRQAGFVVGNIFGKGMDSIPVIVKRDEFRKTVSNHGRNALYKLNMGGNELGNVIIKEIQYEPINREIQHVDFQKVSFSENIKADVAIRAVGKEQLESRRMILLQHLDVLPVKGLPQDIPEFIDIDVKDLNAINIFVSDIKMPEGITPDIEPDRLVLAIEESKSQMVIEEEEEETTEQTE